MTIVGVAFFGQEPFGDFFLKHQDHENGRKIASQKFQVEWNGYVVWEIRNDDVGGSVFPERNVQCVRFDDFYSGVVRKDCLQPFDQTGVSFDEPQIVGHFCQMSREDSFSRTDLDNPARKYRGFPGHGSDAEGQCRIREEVLAEAFLGANSISRRRAGIRVAPFCFQGEDVVSVLSGNFYF